MTPGTIAKSPRELRRARLGPPLRASLALVTLLASTLPQQTVNWRESDVLMVGRNACRGVSSLLYPRIDHQGPEPRITGMELPLLNHLASGIAPRGPRSWSSPMETRSSSGTWTEGASRSRRRSSRPGSPSRRGPRRLPSTSPAPAVRIWTARERPWSGSPSRRFHDGQRWRSGFGHWPSLALETRSRIEPEAQRLRGAVAAGRSERSSPAIRKAPQRTTRKTTAASSSREAALEPSRCSASDETATASGTPANSPA